MCVGEYSNKVVQDVKMATSSYARRPKLLLLIASLNPALLPPIVTLLLLPVCITASSPQFMSTFHIFWRENKIRIQRAKTMIRNSRIQGFNWMTCNRGLPCIFKISHWVIFVVLLVLCSLSKFPKDMARCFIFLFYRIWTVLKIFLPGDQEWQEEAKNAFIQPIWAKWVEAEAELRIRL